MYIDNLDDFVRKCNNTYHTSIKMKPVDVKDNTYIDFKKEVNDKLQEYFCERVYAKLVTRNY